MSWSNAVEERDVLIGVEKPRHPLVLRAMVPGNEGRAVDLAGIADLGGMRVTLEQERRRARAGGPQRPKKSPKKKCKKEQPRCVAVKGAQSEAASIKDSIS
jgi:hypothetical protein